MSGSVLARHRLAVGLACLTLFAWLLREYYVVATIVDVPIRGDIRQYVAYAWNMLHHGTFSQVWPGSGTPVPDTFRGPGYPAFLAAWMWLDERTWYMAALHAQAVAGALTATMTVLLARHWLADRWAFLAGILVAVWPHHVAATGALLSEVVFGFLLVLSLWLVAEAHARRRALWAGLAGIAFSAAALTSMVSLLFPVLASAILWRERQSRAAILLIAFAFAGSAAWAARGAAIDAPPDRPGRMALNLVQGAWPQYHRAYASRNASPIARDIMREIDREERTLASDPVAGIERIGRRMALDPAYFAYWYVAAKPFLLWDWGIRMGAGDIYFHQVRESPFERNPALRQIRNGLRLLNPLVFALSALASVGLLVGWLRKSAWASPAATLVAGFCIYVTVVHVVFQAEPRYSIPYRPMQMLMLASLLSFLLSKRLRTRVA